MLCVRGSQTLQSKSINVEDAANELIDMLCAYEEEEQPEEEEDQEEEEGEGQSIITIQIIHLIARSIKHKTTNQFAMVNVNKKCAEIHYFDPSCM